MTKKPDTSKDAADKVVKKDFSETRGSMSTGTTG